MAVYKVAQDVEADDKLLGPFSFRQFVYLIIVAISLGLAWGLSQLFIALAIIPLPITILFGALALPLRKDQPMEVYLAAIVSYYLKPRKRLWIPDGIESLVEITAPKVIEVQRAKDITQVEAEKRLSYLANIADTEGWAIRHAAKPFNESPLVSDVYNDAQRAEDILDTDGNVSRSLDMMLDQSDERHRQEVVARMHQAFTTPPENLADTHMPPTQHTSEHSTHQSNISPQFNPYPTIRQSVIQPLTPSGQSPVDPNIPPSNTQPHQTQQTDSLTSDNPSSSTSKKAVSPDIINLANNPDLSIETIQREANRIQEKEDEGEVFISLH
ncbi:PrgI family protein [Candidatus Saccharibacteria bacterium]|jgi:hypothetical protein cdiviTM7_00587|nr:PrgI family protein [Candidatus Saccharibacteria bacterium]